MALIAPSSMLFRSYQGLVNRKLAEPVRLQNIDISSIGLGLLIVSDFREYSQGFWPGPVYPVIAADDLVHPQSEKFIQVPIRDRMTACTVMKIAVSQASER